MKVFVRLYEAAPTAQTCYSLFLCISHRRRGMLQPARTQTERGNVQTNGFQPVKPEHGRLRLTGGGARAVKSVFPKKCSPYNSGGNHPLFGSGKFPPNMIRRRAEDSRWGETWGGRALIDDCKFKVRVTDRSSKIFH